MKRQVEHKNARIHQKSTSVVVYVLCKNNGGQFLDHRKTNKSYVNNTTHQTSWLHWAAGTSMTQGMGWRRSKSIAEKHEVTGFSPVQTREESEQQPSKQSKAWRNLPGKRSNVPYLFLGHKKWRTSMFSPEVPASTFLRATFERSSHLWTIQGDHIHTCHVKNYQISIGTCRLPVGCRLFTVFSTTAASSTSRRSLTGWEPFGPRRSSVQLPSLQLGFIGYSRTRSIRPGIGRLGPKKSVALLEQRK